MSYTPVSRTGLPYTNCWNWDSFPGTQFAARADSWTPVYYDDREYRCIPDLIPAEFQMFNMSPPCAEAACTICKGKNAYGSISSSGGSCPSCKKSMLAFMAGYAWDKDVPNPQLYSPV